MKIITKSLSVDPAGSATTLGHLVLRITAAGMIFYIHGWHKLEGWLAYAQHGTPWTLRTEVAGMHFPSPYVSAIAATILQFICPLFIGVGLFTRINSLLLAS